MDLLQEVADGTFKVETIKDPETGTYEQRLLVELPPEEAFESFAARVRPFTISDEPVNWALVLDAVEGLTPQETLDEVIQHRGAARRRGLVSPRAKRLRRPTPSSPRMGS